MKKLVLLLSPVLLLNIWISGNADEVPVHEIYGISCSEEPYNFTFTTEIHSLSNPDQKNLIKLDFFDCCNLQPNNILVLGSKFLYSLNFRYVKNPGKLSNQPFSKIRVFSRKRAPPVSV